MFADIGNLIGLLIFAAVAIASALMKKKQKDEDQPFDLPPEIKPRRDRPTPPPSRSWEEELRALLEERPAPPPIVQHVPPPAPRLPPPRPVMEPQWDEGHGESELPAPHRQLAPAFQPLPGLRDSQEKYGHASHLQERVAEYMGDAIRPRVGTTLVHRAAATMEAVDVAQMIRTPRGIRTAMIASIILGPPRALEG